MISIEQQQQLEKYVAAFQSCAQEGGDPRALRTLLPEFYHFVGGCKKQVEKSLDQSQDISAEETNVAKGLLKNLDLLHSSLLETSKQLGIDLDAHIPAVNADHKTQEIRINFEQCHQDSLKNVVIQAIRDTLDVEAPLADSTYAIAVEADHSVTIRVIHQEPRGTTPS